MDNSTLLERYNLDTLTNPIKPVYSFNGYKQEGFGNWCPTELEVSEINLNKIFRSVTGQADGSNLL